MNSWKHLDLRYKDQRPKIGELVAMRLIPNNSRATFYSSEKYEIGHFGIDRDGKNYGGITVTERKTQHV